MKTIPTGFSVVPPPGPAMPVTQWQNPRPFAGARLRPFRAPPASLTAHAAASVSARTPEKFLLRLVAVGHKPAHKNHRCARHIRHAMRDATAGAGFRQRQGFFRSVKSRNNDDSMVSSSKP